ncbi:DUF1801 domain-containing protein [Shinella daejeonensis]|uniref:DUF1801 domain-containing protein n=1 Tax=Shinella daejeonensis TaxID=659017 RepID=UPI0020C800E5|nr:DUF1801 domain-containing protein [Shinella daejeonensis]MCP8893935.1 DUF1801 domain-containing protein [Shinella daejeonensis]
MTPIGKEASADDPQAYLARLSGWRKQTVETLRATILASGALKEGIGWGHLVYSASGPVLLVRAEKGHVLLGLWRGRGLRDIEPRLRPGGRRDMATMAFLEGDTVETRIVSRLVREAVRLDARLGDPTTAG